MAHEPSWGKASSAPGMGSTKRRFGELDHHCPQEALSLFVEPLRRHVPVAVEPLRQTIDVVARSLWLAGIIR